MLNLGLSLLHNSSWTEGILPYLRDTVTLDPNVVKVCFLQLMIISSVTTQHSGQKTREEAESTHPTADKLKNQHPDPDDW